MTVKILLAVEGTSDVRRVRILLDRWLADNVDWFSDEHPELCRAFIGLDEGSEFVSVKSIPSRRKAMSPGGRFGAPHPSGDAGTLRDLRILMDRGEVDADVVIWMRDSDGRDDRHVQAAAHIREHGEQERFILGYARQAGEAWVLVGWYAQTDADRTSEAALTRQTSRKLPRDAHMFAHAGHQDGKWAVRQLGLDGERERFVVTCTRTLACAGRSGSPRPRNQSEQR